MVSGYTLTTFPNVIHTATTTTRSKSKSNNKQQQTSLCSMRNRNCTLPGNFHDLKTTLQTEFNLLKKATSKNIENLQEAIQSQQAYTTALYGHINLLYNKLAQLDRQVQMYCLYPHLPIRCSAVKCS